MNATLGRFWEEGVKRSKIPRFDWKSLIGSPLTTWCYEQFGRGGTPKTCQTKIIRKLEAFYDNDMWFDNDDLPRMSFQKAKENAKTRIAAAWTEWRSANGK